MGSTISTSGIHVCRRGEGGPLLVFLHAGVADLRAWRAQLEHFSRLTTTLAYDRRGFGMSQPAVDSMRGELTDLTECIGDQNAVIVGNSQGGRIALDFTLTHPDQVAALVLIGSAVAGAPEWDEDVLSSNERHLFAQIEQADLAGELDRVNSLEAWVWLDGPDQPQGRVRGGARDLFLQMNRLALAGEDAQQAIASTNAWERLSEIAAPALVIDGSFDVSAIQRQSRRIARDLQDAEHVVLAGCGHLPGLEQPQQVNAVIESFLRRRGVVSG